MRQRLEKQDLHPSRFQKRPPSLRTHLPSTFDDGSGTDRMVVIGTSVRDRVLYVVHVERGQRDRIISARPATRPERDVYELGEQA